tara:strand:- start:192 stop:368 length:177 start_codon:yes stop_codon:yes gene_type:complete
MNDRRILCQIKKHVNVADATPHNVNATVADMDSEEPCPVCQCDPCDCGWGAYIAHKKR